MEILWLLIPMSAVLVLVVIAVFGWALHRGQFDDLEQEGQRILLDEVQGFEAGPARVPDIAGQSPSNRKV